MTERTETRNALAAVAKDTKTEIGEETQLCVTALSLAADVLSAVAVDLAKLGDRHSHSVAWARKQAKRCVLRAASVTLAGQKTTRSLAKVAKRDAAADKKANQAGGKREKLVNRLAKARAAAVTLEALLAA